MRGRTHLMHFAAPIAVITFSVSALSGISTSTGMRSPFTGEPPLCGAQLTWSTGRYRASGVKWTAQAPCPALIGHLFSLCQHSLHLWAGVQIIDECGCCAHKRVERMIVAMFVNVQRERIQVWKMSAAELVLGLMSVIAGNVTSDPEEIRRTQVYVRCRSLSSTT